jgi:hypothetical protein
MNQAKGTNLIFNLQFQIPSVLQSVLKFSISDFAFLHKYISIYILYNVLIHWEKLCNFLNSRGLQVKNRCYRQLLDQLGNYKVLTGRCVRMIRWLVPLDDQ